MLTLSIFIKSQFHFFWDLKNRWTLISALVNKDIKSRYAGSVLGILWAVFQPIAFVGIYTLIFSLVFRSTVPDAYLKAPFVIFLICGLIPYQIFSETLSRSSSVLLENISMITKMVFPYELFPVSILISSFITAGITLIVTAIIMAVFGIVPSISNLFYLPLFLIPLVLLVIGLSWIVSCVSIVLRDLTHIVPVIINILFFATPVFYSYEMLDKMSHSYPIITAILKLNPLYTVVIGFRISLIGKDFFLDPTLIITTYGISILTFMIGGMIFNAFKRELADFL